MSSFLVGCISQSVEEAQVEFCQALATYGQSVRELENVSANTTVDELQMARENVAEARQVVAETAVDLREAQVRSAEDAWENVQDEINKILYAIVLSLGTLFPDSMIF